MDLRSTSTRPVENDAAEWHEPVNVTVNVNESKYWYQCKTPTPNAIIHAK